MDTLWRHLSSLQAGPPGGRGRYREETPCRHRSRCSRARSLCVHQLHCACGCMHVRSQSACATRRVCFRIYLLTNLVPSPRRARDHGLLCHEKELCSWIRAEKALTGDEDQKWIPLQKDFTGGIFLKIEQHQEKIAVLKQKLGSEGAKGAELEGYIREEEDAIENLQQEAQARRGGSEGSKKCKHINTCLLSNNALENYVKSS